VVIRGEWRKGALFVDKYFDNENESFYTNIWKYFDHKLIQTRSKFASGGVPVGELQFVQKN